MHKTTFHIDSGDVLLFPSWILHGKKETYLSCLLIVFLGVVYQGIKFARHQYGRKCHNLNCKRYILTRSHLLQTLLYLLQFAGGYVLMLSAMTYNLWLFSAVLIGFGLGYFLFGWGEYEAAAGLIPVPSSAMCGSGRDGARRTGGRPGHSLIHSYASGRGMGLKTSASTNSANQELLPLSKSEEEVGDMSTSNLSGCHCGTSKV